MKDSTKVQVRSLLHIISGEIHDGRDSDGTINISAVLAALNAVASEYYTQQKCDAGTIGATVDELLVKFPTLGKISVAAMAARQLSNDDGNNLPFALLLKKVTEFVDSAYTVKRGKITISQNLASKP
jgi:hypothetical protein